MKDLENMKFEEAMENLEKIANDLENEELDLDTSLSKFEEGMQLSKKCSQMLENAEKKITILIKKDEEITEEKFEME